MVVLERSAGSRRHGEPPLDPTQRAAAAHRGGRAVVLGAPGTGKTTVAVAAVLDRIAGGAAPDSCLVLAGSRLAAAALRERISAAVGRTATEPAARTASSLAFGLLRRQATLDGLPAPRLLSGPEQDVILRELLAGHAAGTAPAPGWPADLDAALGTRGFRAELRDLLMRAAERGLAPADLADLGRRHDRPEWVAAARVAAEYDEVTALARPGGLDPAALLAAAADLVHTDPDLLDRALPGLTAVVVDDAQDLTPPGARLVSALTTGGADLVLIGDPDAATQAFRGGDPRLFRELAGRGTEYVLGRRWRQPRRLAEVAARVAGRIGSGGAVPHRGAEPGPPRPPADTRGAGAPTAADPDGDVRVMVARSATQEARHVAEHLRRRHLLDGVPWSAMAVIVRGARMTGTLRRVLSGAGVPVTVPGAQVPLRDEPVVAALLDLLRIVLVAAADTADAARQHPAVPGEGGGPAAPDAGQLTGAAAPHVGGSDDASRLGGCGAVSAAQVVDLLGSPLGGMDAVAVRRLRRAVRAAEIGPAGGGRGVDAALVGGLLGDGGFDALGPEAAGARRLARAVAAGRSAAARQGDRWAPGVTAETVLWALWSGLGLAEPWRRTALDGGPGAARADRALDAVVALFEAAATYVDRLPGRGPDGFLEHLAAQDVAGDLLAAAAPVGEAVTLTTPAGAAGLEWDVVAVCGVQEGVWPDLRLRGSVLGSQRLVDVLSGRSAGPREAVTAVRHDETRLFLVAVSRARRDLLVTATSNEDEQPSPFVDLVDPRAAGGAEGRGTEPVLEAMSPAGVVARLRRELAGAPDRATAGAVARRLALLAAAGVPGTDPARWRPLVEPTDDRPRRAGELPVRVSPSRVEAFGQCELRWLLDAAGGERPRGVGADAVGSLVHAVVAEVDNSDVAAMQAAIDERWPGLGLPPGWLSERGRRQAHEMVARVARYDAEARDQGWTVVGHERAAAAVVGRAEVRGRVDRLERDADGRLRVVDLKTGSSKPSKGDMARLPQLGAYQVLVESGDLDRDGAGRDPATAAGGAGRSAGAALLQVGKAAAAGRVDLQVQPPLAADDDPRWAHRLLDETAGGMAGGGFTARAGDWCRMCAGRACCPISGDGEVV